MRPMSSVQGELWEGVLPGVLRKLYVGRRTGVLSFVRGEERYGLRFRQGHILGAETGVRGQRLGEMLVRLGRLSQADLDRALESMARDGKRLGAVLIDMGLLDVPGLETVIAAHAHDVLQHLFSWTEGSYEFVDEPPDKAIDADVTLRLSTGELILQAARGVRDPDVVRFNLGNIDHVLALSADPLLRYQRISLGPADGYVLSRVDGTLSAREIIQITPLRSEDVLRSLFGLLSTGVLEYVGEEAEPAVQVQTRPPGLEHPSAVEAPPSKPAAAPAPPAAPSSASEPLSTPHPSGRKEAPPSGVQPTMQEPTEPEAPSREAAPEVPSPADGRPTPAEGGAPSGETTAPDGPPPTQEAPTPAQPVPPPPEVAFEEPEPTQVWPTLAELGIPPPGAVSEEPPPTQVWPTLTELGEAPHEPSTAAPGSPPPAPRLPPVETRRLEILEAYDGLDRTHFEVLGVPRDATEAQVREAYFRLARRFHPDVHHDRALSDLRDELEEVFGRLGEAYEVLCNPRMRASYERGLARREGTARGASPDARDEAERTAEAIRQGQASLDQERYWEAIRLLEPAVLRAEGPLRQEARILLAHAYAKNPGWVKQGEEMLLAVLREQPENVNAGVELGRIYAEQGLRHRAQSVLRRVLELQPGHDEARRLLAGLGTEETPPAPVGRRGRAQTSGPKKRP